MNGLRPELLLDVELRVHAELGRTTMVLDDALALPDGAIVDLDRAADDAIDVYVNGQRFAGGRLVVIDDEWCVRLEALDAAWTTALALEH